MRFLLLVIHDDTFTPPAHLEEEAVKWVDEVDRQKKRVLGERLVPATKAKVIQVRNGETIVTDGPWHSDANQIDGFDILECDNVQDAIEVAAKHPMAKIGMIEIREFWED